MDIVILDMVYFDIIFGIDCLYLCHTILDCFSKMVTLVVPGGPKVEWKGSCGSYPGKVISYIRAQRLINKVIYPTWPLFVIQTLIRILWSHSYCSCVCGCAKG